MINQTNRLPLRASMFWTPDHFGPAPAWFEHAPFAFWLIDTLRPKSFVELGTHAGFSYFCFCQAVAKLKMKTKCRAVDTWQGDEHAGFYDEKIYNSVIDINKSYEKNSHLVRSTFDNALSKFPDKSIDLLHIDGRHFYDDVKHDYESWLPKLTDDSIVLFHDTNVMERDFGVWKLFKSLKKRHTGFEFLHGHGLGVLAPNNVPKVMVPFFAENPELLRKVFYALGVSISDSDHMRKIEGELVRVKADLQEQISIGGQMETRLKNESLNREAIAQLQIENRRLSEEQKSLRELIARITAQQDRREAKATSESAAQQSDVFEVFGKLNRQLNSKRSLRARAGKLIKSKLRPTATHIQDIRNSVFFDADWYLFAYPDVAAAAVDPAQHYLQWGASEGRDPGPYFSTSAYIARHPELLIDGQNPLLHQLRPSPVKFVKRLNTAANEDFTDADRTAIHKHIDSFLHQPLISVVMPVYNTPETFLKEAVASVLAQLYPNWELCIANDASPDENVARVLNELAATDKRVKVVHHQINGNISAATNSALELAEGEFIALMDHDDLLHETALYEVAAEINMYPDVDVIYSDEDKIDENGKRSTPYYKPDFNPELFLSQNMVSHLGIYRKSLVDKIGGLRLGFEGSQDYDLALRAWANSDLSRIRHIPAILYHWRQNPGHSSFSAGQLDKCTAAARAAIQEFLDQKIPGAKVGAVAGFEHYSRVQFPLPQPLPLVSVIVPTKDKAELVAVCADGILNKTSYKNLELLIIDHESVEPQTRKLFDELKRDPRVRVLHYSGSFNYSAMNNMAVKKAKGSIIALLNNDIEIIEPGWLMEMVSHAIRPEVGAVGAKLYYPDLRIQHAGVVIGLGGVAGHAMHLQQRSSHGYFGQGMLARATTAVTGACLVVRKSVYKEVDGLDFENLPVAFNDVDFCLKVQAKGYRNVWTPFAELIHHESVSRGPEDTPAKSSRFNRECEYMNLRWSKVIANDSCHNPNLTLSSQNYEPAMPTRRKKPWATFL
jgi:O-antigen biosynthesis protein